MRSPCPWGAMKECRLVPIYSCASSRVEWHSTCELFHPSTASSLQFEHQTHPCLICPCCQQSGDGFCSACMLKLQYPFHTPTSTPARKEQKKINRHESGTIVSISHLPTENFFPRIFCTWTASASSAKERCWRCGADRSNLKNLQTAGLSYVLPNPYIVKEMTISDLIAWNTRLEAVRTTEAPKRYNSLWHFRLILWNYFKTPLNIINNFMSNILVLNYFIYFSSGFNCL